MSTIGIVITVVLALVAVLFLTGLVLNGRRRAATEGAYRAKLDAVNRQLAEAHAQDNGWAPATVEAAARSAFAADHPGAPVDAVDLVQVVDLPGTDDDQAIFRITSGEHHHTVVLGRRGGEWQPV
jgi:predicted cobalt transporter CbtA